MSKKVSFIELTPGHISPRGRNGEDFISKGHQCSYCHGTGFVWGRDREHESIQADCPICEGSGKLDAFVSIKWKAGR